MKDHACIVTHGYHTDIALKIYSNRIFLIITHFKKFGSLIAISRGTSVCQYNNSIYSTKILFGKDDVEIMAAARYIAEQINADKPLLISISLKDYELDTLKTIVKTINDMKAW
ncbi:Proteasome assembly chaperone 3 [Eufriesea mexicana]|uniref:Proteasome assembly chaperone 3 n=1 Tax=Eufriesea mexicana TaxID=516756 RepID=A0A310S3X4_9HYME|nr:PREDICTED: proteasome assembly chaperone 3-like [Eufriesea mexicana]OAD46961.1 Proteasome assembly chaperone 3 [Eufriesea mexicana]